MMSDKVLSKEELNQVLGHAASGATHLARANYCDEVRDSHEALRAQRNEARRKFCQLEAFRRNGCGGLFISAFSTSAHDVCKSFWPDAADELFPETENAS